LLNQRAFEVSEVGFSVVGKDLWDGFLFGGFDEMIHVEEGKVKLGCELFAYRGFSGAHKPN
jgi:hypothetical protein